MTMRRPCCVLPSLPCHLVLSFGGFRIACRAQWRNTSVQRRTPFTRSQKDNFSFESISPTEELVWTDRCSDNQCVRLKVMGKSRALRLHPKMNSVTRLPLDYA
ncbi:hypothetical protein B0H14DRAFT_2476253 [Mycena olivaceomarginata]|nr:hypothetical protein B0H14DRAFT_2476253 [Mycena olivaceomarginata]